MQDLFEAIAAGDRKKVTQLVQQDPAVAASRNPQGISALMLALYQHDGNLVETLVDAIPELDLDQAAALGDAARVATLLDTGIPFEDFTPDGFSPLHLAAFFGHTEVVRRLLDHGAAIDIVATNGSALRPLNSAVAGGHTETVALLLERGADHEARQAGGFTPLMGAAAGGHEAIARRLLDHGVDATETSDDGRTPVDLARERGHEGLLELLDPTAD